MTPALPDFPLTGGSALVALARRHGCSTFAQLAGVIERLPYGRPHAAGKIGSVLTENKGTCSSKHRLLAAVAAECGRPDVRLMVGIYPMCEQNTPGVGAALGAVSWIPEAHCYLAYAGARFDLTGLKSGAASPFEALIKEHTVAPDDLPAIKAALHRKALGAWALAHDIHPDDAWALRERCIRMLSTS